MTGLERNKLWRRLSVLIPFGVVVAGMTWWLTLPEPIPDQALRRVPEGSPAALWVKMEPLLESRLVRRLLERGGRDEGMRRIERDCGFDPLEMIDDAVVFVRSDQGEELGAIGFVARGTPDLDHRRLVECVGKAVQSEGGRVREIEIDGVPAIAARGGSRAAFVGRDGIAGGNDDTVRDVIRTLRGDDGSASDDASLRRLWDKVSGGREAVLVTRLPTGWRRALVRLVGAAIEGSAEPLRGVRALGIGARVSNGLGIGIAAETRSPEDARALTSAVRDEIQRALREPAVSLTAIGSVLRRVRSAPEQSDAVFVVDLRDDLVEDAADLLEDLLEERDERDPPAPRPDPPPPPEPDEVIRSTD